MGRVCS